MKNKAAFLLNFLCLFNLWAFDGDNLKHKFRPMEENVLLYFPNNVKEIVIHYMGWPGVNNLLILNKEFYKKFNYLLNNDGVQTNLFGKLNKIEILRSSSFERIGIFCEPSDDVFCDLKELSISNCTELKKVFIYECPNLTKALMPNNNIEYVSLRNLENLSYLDVSNNLLPLKALNINLASMTRLKTVIFSYYESRVILEGEPAIPEWNVERLKAVINVFNKINWYCKISLEIDDLYYTFYGNESDANNKDIRIFITNIKNMEKEWVLDLADMAYFHTCEQPAISYIDDDLEISFKSIYNKGLNKEGILSLMEEYTMIMELFKNVRYEDDNGSYYIMKNKNGNKTVLKILVRKKGCN